VSCLGGLCCNGFFQALARAARHRWRSRSLAPWRRRCHCALSVCAACRCRPPRALSCSGRIYSVFARYARRGPQSAAAGSPRSDRIRFYDELVMPPTISRAHTVTLCRRCWRCGRSRGAFGRLLVLVLHWVVTVVSVNRCNGPIRISWAIRLCDRGTFAWIPSALHAVPCAPLAGLTPEGKKLIPTVHRAEAVLAMACGLPSRRRASPYMFAVVAGSNSLDRATAPHGRRSSAHLLP